MSSSETLLSAAFFLDDLPSAAVRASRLHDILVRLQAGLPLSTLQQGFLEERHLKALLGLSRGVLTSDEFILLAAAEQRARIAASAEAKEREEEGARLRRKASDRKNAGLFAAQERKRARRKLFDDFGIGYVDADHFSRVRRICQQVSKGAAIGKEDLIWLAKAGHEYWTAELRCAHHRILAERFALEWRESGDPWKAVNACSRAPGSVSSGAHGPTKRHTTPSATERPGSSSKPQQVDTGCLMRFAPRTFAPARFWAQSISRSTLTQRVPSGMRRLRREEQAAAMSIRRSAPFWPPRVRGNAIASDERSRLMTPFASRRCNGNTADARGAEG